MIEIPTPPPPPPAPPKAPPRYEYRIERHNDLIVIGTAIGGSCYVLGALLEGLLLRSWYGAIPVAGPLVDGVEMGRTQPPMIGAFALLTAAQLTGIGFVIAGFKTKHRVRVEGF